MSADYRGILFVGGRDAGKTNFLARLWLALFRSEGALEVSGSPQDIEYVERAVEHLLKGSFAPRSLPEEERPRDFRATVEVRRGTGAGTRAEVLVPDTLGELWSKAVATREIDQEWMDAMKRCEGALLFLRIESDQNRTPLDWVTSRQLMASKLAADNDKRREELPTQVFLCELLKFLESTLRGPADGALPRVAVIVSAWDLLDRDRARSSPLAILAEEFPMFAGRIEDCSRLEVEVFGSSVVGGDLNDDEEFKRRYIETAMTKPGYVVVSSSTAHAEHRADFTLPIAWVLGVGDWKTR